MVVQAAIRLDGKVYTGHRHADILREARTKHGLGFGGLRFGEQGFVTDTGVFLSREEARQHFIDSGQTPAHGTILSDTRLDSSDLY